MPSMKLLFCGAVEGAVHDLYKKIDAINRKSGPFDALFCVGQFFGETEILFVCQKPSWGCGVHQLGGFAGQGAGPSEPGCALG